MTKITLQEYINSKKDVKPNQDIIERWQTRVVPAKMHEHGQMGAEQYLKVYGTTAKAPKCVMFARYAEICLCHEMALGFWKRAYELEIGLPINPDDLKNIQSVAKRMGDQADQEINHAQAISKTLQKMANYEVNILDFPQSLQPGRFAPMQPTDAKHDRPYYITNSRYWGQRKRNGVKLIIFAGHSGVYYQSRSIKMSAPPSLEFDDCMKEAVSEIDSFVVEGELYYLDVEGREHQDAATCMASNTKLRQPEVMPVMRYAIFACHYRSGVHFYLSGYFDMVNEGREIAQYLRVFQGKTNEIFEVMDLAKTETQKALLCDSQIQNGREGEVWFTDRPYKGGKHNDDSIIRTKYLTDPTLYIISEVFPSTAEGHTISGFAIETLDGIEKGNVGTGYTREEQKEILSFHNADPGNVRVLIVSQGYTVYGKPKHARFAGFAPRDWEGDVAE